MTDRFFARAFIYGMCRVDTPLSIRYTLTIHVRYIGTKVVTKPEVEISNMEHTGSSFVTVIIFWEPDIYTAIFGDDAECV